MLNALLKWQFPLYTADSVTFAMLLPNRIYLQARCMFYELVERRAVQRQPYTVQTGGNRYICSKYVSKTVHTVDEVFNRPPNNHPPPAHPAEKFMTQNVSALSCRDVRAEFVLGTPAH